jgi:hypothetical protein
METVTCSACGATAVVGDDRSVIANRKEMEGRCKHWPPANQRGFMGSLITGCENLDQAVTMATVYVRPPPRPIA